MLFIPNHSTFGVLECWHKDNEEEYSWCADEDNGNNHIVCEEFNQVRHNKTLHFREKNRGSEDPPKL
jgi:hypothetical protein